jgi:hypothetical protein
MISEDIKLFLYFFNQKIFGNRIESFAVLILKIYLLNYQFWIVIFH